MIHRLDLVDNPRIREIAMEISKLPDVKDVRWWPPYKKETKEKFGEDAITFSLIIELSDERFSENLIAFSRGGWENDTMETIIDAINKLIDQAFERERLLAEAAAKVKKEESAANTSPVANT